MIDFQDEEERDAWQDFAETAPPQLSADETIAWADALLIGYRTRSEALMARRAQAQADFEERMNRARRTAGV